MEEAEAALHEIAVLLRRLADEAAADGSTSVSASISSRSSRARDKDGAERLFATLAQQHQYSVVHPHLPSWLLPCTRGPKRGRVVPSPSFTPQPSKSSSTHVSYAQLRDFLQRHGVHLSARRFRALVRFFDSDLCGHVDLQDFKSLLQADHLFCAVGQHPSAARVARRLSQLQSQGQGQQPQERVLVDVGRLLRHGSSALEDGDGEPEEGGRGPEEVL